MAASRPELRAVPLAGRDIEWALVAMTPESPSPAAEEALRLLRTAEMEPTGRPAARPRVTAT
jgi:hypothetical protein